MNELRVPPERSARWGGPKVLDGITTAGHPNRHLGYKVLFVTWSLFCLLSYAHFRTLAQDGHESVLVGLLKFLTCYYPWLLLTPLLFRLEHRFPLTRPYSVANGMTFFLLGLPFCYGVSLAALNTIPFLEAGFGRWRTPTPWTLHVRATEWELQCAIYLVTLGASAFFRYLAEVGHTEQQAAELTLEKAKLESALRQAELETLRMRLNPHFLFNSLQSISALAGDDANAARTMLARLGDLLRVALRSNYQTEICLAEEIDLTRAYVSMEQVRFGSRLSVLFDLHPLVERALVPSLLLQPLVENAIKHGLSGQDGAGIIWVSSTVEGSKLRLTVRDNGKGFEEDTGRLPLGVGLGATRERLRQLYAEGQELSWRRLPEGGTEVAISLPAQFAGETEGYHRRPSMTGTRAYRGVGQSS